MIGQLEKFTIHDLWGKKQVELRFSDNKLILVGENGSGKTSILRILYETLACKWAQLSVEDFTRVDLQFADGKPLVIYKSRIQAAKDLLVDIESPTLKELPIAVRRSLNEQASISGRDISYDQIIDIMDEYGYSETEAFYRIKEKVGKVETAKLNEYSSAIKKRLGCNVIYLPTYRRVEKRIGYINEREYFSRRTFNYRYNSGIRNFSNQSIEIAKTGMDDVEYFIQLNLDDIRRQADISASRLNYQCFKGILNKSSDSVKYNKEILSASAIEKVFGSIDEHILSPEESRQIRQQLKEMESAEAPRPQTYEQIVYYYYSMLYERYLQLTKSKEVISAFFSACNTYLGNKEFVYDETEHKYSIMVNDNGTSRTIDLEHLSSGEKQVVSIFSYLYLSPLSKSIVLIDEPELSLSVPWQKKFLLDIANGNQCAGIIAVTHSPFVFDNVLKSYAHALEEFIQ